MRNGTFDKKALSLLQGRVTCKVAEINLMLAPDLREPLPPDQMRERASHHMASLPPADQERLRMKALVAYAELERLTDEMAQQLHALTAEIGKVTRHKQANVAYRQAPAGFGSARI